MNDDQVFALDEQFTRALDADICRLRMIHIRTNPISRLKAQYCARGHRMLFVRIARRRAISKRKR